MHVARTNRRCTKHVTVFVDKDLHPNCTRRVIFPSFHWILRGHQDKSFSIENSPANYCLLTGEFCNTPLYTRGFISLVKRGQHQLISLHSLKQFRSCPISKAFPNCDRARVQWRSFLVILMKL